MKVLNRLRRFFVRLRHPFSLPEDVASDLGLNLSNYLSVSELICSLASPECRPTKLIKFMPREQAEQRFSTALRKEIFRHNSLFSYYFNGEWVEFVLQFDEHSRLRRLYLRHKNLKQKCEISISP